MRLPGTPKNETLTIDALTLAVSYLPPSLRKAQDDQIIYAPGGDFHGVFVVQGATFAPNGYVDLDPGSFDTALVAFRWGLVASGVNLKAQPSQTFGYPLVSMPVAGKGLGNKVTIVDLKVYVCIEQATCTTGGTHALTVRAMITDPPYTAWGTGPARPEPAAARWRSSAGRSSDEEHPAHACGSHGRTARARHRFVPQRGGPPRASW